MATNREKLLDRNFHVIGYIETDTSNGKQRALDAHFHVVGHYDPKTNKTLDSHFHVVGTGNLLASLIR